MDAYPYWMRNLRAYFDITHLRAVYQLKRWSFGPIRAAVAALREHLRPLPF